MKKKDNLERIVPKAVALGMGVASIVLSLIKPEVNVSLFFGDWPFLPGSSRNGRGKIV